MPVLRSIVLATAFKIDKDREFLIFIACDMSLCVCYAGAMVNGSVYMNKYCHTSVMSRFQNPIIRTIQTLHRRRLTVYAKSYTTTIHYHKH